MIHRQGILSGDLNPVQQYALAWCLADEHNEAFDLEQERMKYTIFASDPDLYRRMFEQEPQDDWIVPIDPAEESAVLAQIEEFQRVHENF